MSETNAVNQATEESDVERVVRWQLKFDELHLVCGDKHYATVFNNGVWHTWNSDGIGLENSSSNTVQRAMEEAAQSAISQGLITT